MNFSDWLLEQLHDRDWSQADLARASGLTRATISYYLGPKSKKPDENALRQIAKAFKLSPETVFRASGILPPSVDDPWVEKMNHKIGQLSGARREMAERLLDTLLSEQERETRQVKESRT